MIQELRKDWRDFCFACGEAFGGMFGFVALMLIVIGAIVGWARPAHSHEDGAMSYPPRCCYGTPVVGDCAPIEGVDAVQFRQGGWFIVETGETIPFDKTEPSNDLRFHRCKKPDNTTRCLFVPGSGT